MGDVSEVRAATPEEASAIGASHAEGYERWVAVLIEDEEIRGHICLSRAFGQVLGHDTKSWASDRFGALKLWRAARRKAREWGVSEVLVHFEQENDPMLEFWISRGFKPACVVYKGAI